MGLKDISFKVWRDSWSNKKVASATLIATTNSIGNSRSLYKLPIGYRICNNQIATVVPDLIYAITIYEN